MTTVDDVRKEARKSLARERRKHVVDPYELARRIIDANSLDDLLVDAKGSYRITLKTPGETWTEFKDCLENDQDSVKKTLMEYYKCEYICSFQEFTLFYDRDGCDLGESDESEYM